MKKLLSCFAVILLMSGCAQGQENPDDPVIEETEPLFTLETYPKIDGSTVTIPLSEALIAETCQIDAQEATRQTLHNTTHNAYVNLIEDQADLIFVTYASEEELQMARDAGKELIFTPIVNDAFVFFVNKENPVDELTVEQIQKIYTGEITNWKEVGGNDEEIIAYQRPDNSGSQSGMLELVMKDLPIMDAPTEKKPYGMGDIIDAVANYENSSAAIGYSYYYYANNMYYKDQVKLIKVDGIAPNNDTIAAQEYPFMAHYYAVTASDCANAENVNKLLDYILSEAGQDLMEECGYVRTIEK